MSIGTIENKDTVTNMHIQNSSISGFIIFYSVRLSIRRSENDDRMIRDKMGGAPNATFLGERQTLAGAAINLRIGC
jgi:hypothetical protein